VISSRVHDAKIGQPIVELTLQRQPFSNVPESQARPTLSRSGDVLWIGNRVGAMPRRGMLLSRHMTDADDHRVPVPNDFAQT
jgi:hypothetical protein